MKASLTDVILERFAYELPDEFNRGKDSPQDRPRLVTYGKPNRVILTMLTMSSSLNILHSIICL